MVALPPSAVVLDRTFFYPGGGGQPPDRGSIVVAGADPAAVVDVARSGREVLHRLARSRGGAARTWRIGEEVEGMIDWDRRFAHMRLHTGQHLASALLFSGTGLRTRRAVLSGRGGTIDLEGPAPTGPAWDDWAAGFERAVAEDRSVRVRHVAVAEYERSPSPRSGLVPLPPGLTEVRLIEIDGSDASPCGGTHLRSTGEIGRFDFLPPTPAAPERVAFTLGPSASGPPTPSE